VIAAAHPAKSLFINARLRTDWYCLTIQAAACNQLGMFYAAGDLVAQNYTKAARWYAQAAVHGDVAGRYNLAFLHLRGLGVRQDKGCALALLAQAADVHHRDRFIVRKRFVVEVIEAQEDAERDQQGGAADEYGPALGRL